MCQLPTSYEILAPPHSSAILVAAFLPLPGLTVDWSSFFPLQPGHPLWPGENRMQFIDQHFKISWAQSVHFILKIGNSLNTKK